MNVIMPDYCYVGLDKTGSSWMRALLREIDDWVRFPKETAYELPAEASGKPIIGSIRNPFTWYPAYWVWYAEVHPHQLKNKLSGAKTFEEWVRKCPDAYVKEFHRIYVDTGVVFVRMENIAEDLIAILQDIRGQIPEEIKRKIRTFPKVNVGPKSDYSDMYTSPDLKEYILVGAREIFERFYKEDLDED